MGISYREGRCNTSFHFVNLIISASLKPATHIALIMLDTKIFLLALCCLLISSVFGNATQDTGSRQNAECSSVVCSQQSSYNLASEIIDEVSKQIKMEFDASHTYLAMAAYFGRDDVSYRGFAKFFMKASEEEREHGVKLVNYLNLRGGYPSIRQIDQPGQKWSRPSETILDPNPVDAFTTVLQLEKDVNSALLDLHWLAQQKNDAHLQDFLEAEFLNEQVDSIRELSGFLTVLKRLQNDHLGIHQLDEEMFNGSR